jgi:hypothetical protein
MDIKKLLLRIKHDSGVSISKMSLLLGLDNHSLFRRVNKGNLKVKDLQKCLECTGQELVIVYKKEKITIDKID